VKFDRTYSDEEMSIAKREWALLGLYVYEWEEENGTPWVTVGYLLNLDGEGDWEWNRAFRRADNGRWYGKGDHLGRDVPTYAVEERGWRECKGDDGSVSWRRWP
jgi:hypothetical protein